MNPEIIVAIVAAGIGLVVTALSGVTALGVKRVLKHTDELKTDSKRHGEAIAAMEVRLPNGEWREIKNSLAGVHGTVREVQTDLSEVKVDVSELKIGFREHALTEKDRMCQAIEETYPRLRPMTARVASARKAQRASR